MSARSGWQRAIERVTLRNLPSGPADSSETTFSVVICAYTEERWDDLVASIRSVAAQSHPALETIVVVDHNPSLLARVRSLPVTAIASTASSRGLSGARNTGVAAASGSVIAFLDDDAAAEPDWLAVLATAYRDDGVIGAGGSAEPVWEAGRPAWFPVEFDWVVGCSYRGLPLQRSTIRNLMGCNMSFRREAFELVGGFDAAVGRIGRRPVGAEETEFCIRLLRHMPDASLIYDPAARVRHHVPAARGTWTYFRSRCIGEGRSKATIGRMVGSRSGLASEARYATRVLPTAFLRSITRALPERSFDPWRRAAAIAAGLGFTVAGYLLGRASGRPAASTVPEG